MDNLKIEYLQVDELTPYEKNNRLHKKKDVDNIAKSIEKYGMNDAIGIWGDRNVVVEGHGRLLACKKLGIDRVPVVRLDHLTDQQRREYAIAHNATAELSVWDTDNLVAELKELDLSGFDFDFDLSALTEDKQEAQEDNFDVDASMPDEPTAKVGDIYQLGKHRLMCGDSTSAADVGKLLCGDRVDMIFTDPPYNVSFNGRSGKFDVIKNDNLSENEFADFIEETVQMIKSIAAPIYYIWCNWDFYGILQSKLEYKACIVWAKNVFGMGKGYRHQHEFCLFNGRIDDSIKNESDLWQIKKDHKYIHPTQKPVELSFRAIGNHSGVQTVLDLFGGSGSTLIGCEQRGVSCYMMELDPKYVDVIVARWERFTGEKAVLLNA